MEHHAGDPFSTFQDITSLPVPGLQLRSSSAWVPQGSEPVIVFPSRSSQLGFDRRRADGKILHFEVK